MNPQANSSSPLKWTVRFLVHFSGLEPLALQSRAGNERSLKIIPEFNNAELILPFALLLTSLTQEIDRFLITNHFPLLTK